MWAYGIEKQFKHNQEVGSRLPSHGIKLLSCTLPEIQPGEVLIKVKSSALNYNSIWSGLQHPVSPMQLISGHVRRNSNDKKHLQDYFIFGSDAAGIIVEKADDVVGWEVGHEVVVHCNVVDTNDPIVQNDAMVSNTQSIWGYETNFGAFAEYCIVKASQLIRKPAHLPWNEAASFSLTLSTAYRMLSSKNACLVRPGQTVLIWGAAGGLGTFAIQICKLIGAKVIAVVSSCEKEELVKDLGADIVIVRGEGVFDKFMHDNGEPDYLAWHKWKNLLKKLGADEIDIVFEHVGQSTLGFSTYITKRGGQVVICAASSGYNATIDLRFLWMASKSIIGSHFANAFEAREAAELIFNGSIKPIIYSTSDISYLGEMADKMYSGDTYGKVVFTHD